MTDTFILRNAFITPVLRQSQRILITERCIDKLTAQIRRNPLQAASITRSDRPDGRIARTQIVYEQSNLR